MIAGKILVVEDEPDIRSLVMYNLAKSGYLVTATSDGHEALDRMQSEHFDMIILDLMLPGMHGFDLCRIIKGSKALGNMPIIMLTARGDEQDKVKGLDLGADDYLTKPFSPKELTARVKAVLRRTNASATTTGPIEFGDLRIDPSAFVVTKNGRRLDLSSTEFNLLLYLVQRPGRVFSRDQLLDAVWQAEAEIDPRTVDVHIRRLRSRIEDDPSEPRYIKTRRGIGYYAEKT